MRKKHRCAGVADRPLFVLEEGDVSQRSAFEKRGEIFDADFTLNNRAGS